MKIMKTLIVRLLDIRSIPFGHISFSCDGKRDYMLRAVKIIPVAFVISEYINLTI